MASAEREKNYGGNTGSLDHIRLRYGSIVSPESVVDKFVQQPDCITCNRTSTGSIPAKQKCEVICGIKEVPIVHRYMRSKLSTNNQIKKS